MKRMSIWLMLLFWLQLGCRTMNQSGVKEIGDDEATLVSKIKTILETNGCPTCHNNYGNPNTLKDWATKTKVTDAFVSQMSWNPPAPDPVNIKGIYRAYPNFFASFFQRADFTTDETALGQYAARIQPAPQMKIADDSFYELKDLLTQLSEFIDPVIRACTTKTSEAYLAHVRKMKTEGWSAKIGPMLKSFGCSSGNSDPSQCFADATKFPIHSDLVNPSLDVAGTRVLEVSEIGSTSFWTRSSPSGRYIANGGPARVDDVEKKIRYLIKGASYDPGFFPDNSGFSFHGSGAVFCSMQSLRATGEPTEFTMGGATWKAYQIDPKNNNMCLTPREGSPTGDISTYQSQGMGPNNRAYVVTGSHQTDSGTGGGGMDMDFGTGNLQVYELKKTTNGYEPGEGPEVNFTLPGEGDFSVSPSTEFLVGRIAAKSGPNQPSSQIGYMTRSLSNMMQQGPNYNSANDPTVSEYCVKGMGSKPQLSLDERFIAFHQYQQVGDALVSDIFVIDVLQPEKVFKVTNFSGGAQFAGRTKALFPHFRADGWLYFLLEPTDGTGGGGGSCDDSESCGPDGQTGEEGPPTAYMMASDIALKIAKAHPLP
ncbi:MAG: hypothetical protein AB7T49_08050 [Oligoflexales bacterium]